MVKNTQTIRYQKWKNLRKVKKPTGDDFWKAVVVRQNLDDLKKKKLINVFLAVSILYPLKTSENHDYNLYFRAIPRLIKE